MTKYGIGRGYDKSRNRTPWFIRVNGKKVGHFATQEERDREYNRRVVEAQMYGRIGVMEITPADRAAIHHMIRESQPHGLTPLEIFQRGLATLGSTARNVKTLEAARSLFIEYVDGRLKRGFIRHRRAKELRLMLARFALMQGGDTHVHRIDRAMIRLYLSRLEIGVQAELNNARALSQFFEWCIGEGWTTTNPVVIESRIERTPATFTPAQVKAVFAKARELHPSLLPMMILQWFAGIRPTATHFMDWRDIDFEKRHIVIQAEANKTRQPDLVDHLPKEFWQKLTPFRQASGPVRAPAHIDRYREVRNALGYGKPPRKPWPTDVARHTFASHLYALTGDIAEVSRALRHTGSKVTLRHYVAKSVSREEGKAYFALSVNPKGERDYQPRDAEQSGRDDADQHRPEDADNRVAL